MKLGRGRCGLASVVVSNTESGQQRPAGRAYLAIQLALWLLAIALLLITPYRVRPLFGGGQLAAHFALFGLLSVVAFSLLGIKRWTIFGLVLLSVATEAIQRWAETGHRGEAVDVFVNLAGIALAAIVVGLFRRVAPKQAPKLAAASSSLAFVFLCALLVISHPRFTRWVECRSVDLSAVTDTSVGRQGPILTLSGRADDSTAGSTRQADGAPALCSAMANNEFTVIVDVATTDLNQTGPTRVVTSSISTNPREVNFHVGQEAGALSLRLRYSADDSILWELVPGIFTDGSARRIAVRFADSELTLFVDGVIRGRYAVPKQAIAHWDPKYPFVVGDELTGERAFVGSIGQVEFYDYGLRIDEIAGLGSPSG